MSQSDQFWQYAARYLASSSPDSNSYSDQRSNCSTQVQTPKETLMFKPAQYRAKAGEYGDLANTSTGLEQRRAFRKLEQRFAVLAGNEQWLADNYQNTVHAEQDRSVGATLADEEELILRCLGAALITQ